MVGGAMNALNSALGRGNASKTPAKWYPACHARLTMRLEEGSASYTGEIALDGEPPVPPPPASPAGALAGAAGELGNAVSALSSLLGGAGQANGKLGLDIGITVDGDKVIQCGVDLSHCTMVFNTFQEADSAEISVPFSIFPISPELVRSVMVEIYGGAVKAEDRGDGLANPANNPPARVEESAKNLLFVGYADEGEIDILRDAVVYKCRDYTGILIDEPAPPRATFDRLQFSQSIDKVVKDFIALYPSCKDLKIVPRGFAGPLPKATSVGERISAEDAAVSAANTEAFNRWMRKKRRPKEPPKAKSPRKLNESAWEVIQQICLECGVRASIELDVLVLRPTPQALADRKMALLPSYQAVIPASQGVAGGPVQCPVYMIGQNCKQTRVSKKFGRFAVPPVIFRSYDPKTGKLYEARSPLTAHSERHPEDRKPKSAESHAHIVTVHNVFDENTLQNIADGYRSDIARNELGISFTTNDLDGMESASDVPGALFLRGGDPICILRKSMGEHDDNKIGMSTMARLENMGGEELASLLKKRGYSPSVARVLANAIKSARQSLYMVRRNTVSFSPRTGFSIEIEACNFLEVRVTPSFSQAMPLPRRDEMGRLQ